MARLCQPGGKANEGAGGARERKVFPGLKTAKTNLSLHVLTWPIEAALDMQIRARLLQGTLGGGGNRGLL